VWHAVDKVQGAYIPLLGCGYTVPLEPINDFYSRSKVTFEFKLFIGIHSCAK